MNEKQRFMNAKKRSGMTNEQKNAAWEQHLASKQRVNTRGRAVARPAPRAPKRSTLSPYAQALLNPFTAPAVGVPTFPMIPSQKNRIFARGQGFCGSDGAGFILVRASAANDVRTAVVSVTPSHLYTVLTATLDANHVAVLNNSPFIDSQIATDDVNFRLVALGVRIRYAGSELNRGGSITIVQDPDHNSLDGQTPAQLLQYSEATRVPFTQEWTYLTYAPVRRSEFEFGDSSVPIHYCMAMWINAAVAGSPFEYEIYQIGEYNGSMVRGKTHTAAMSTDSFQATITHLRDSSTQALGNLSRDLASTASAYAYNALASAGGAAANYALRRMHASNVARLRY